MTDDELEMWATYGEAQHFDNIPLSAGGPVAEVRQLWRVVGALARRILDEPGTTESA